MLLFLFQGNPLKIYFNPKSRRGFAILFWSAMAIFAVAAVWLQHRASAGTEDIEKLLGSAYCEPRILEYRLVGVPYGDLRSSQPISRLSRAALVNAEAILRREFAKHSSEVRWWQMQARAELLDYNPISAAQYLRHALEMSPNDPSLQIDLAVTYAEQASRGQVPRYSDALELLGRVLDADPLNATAVFDRALVEEKVFLLSASIKDWEMYIALDNAGPWSEEAQRHGRGVKKLFAKHLAALKDPLRPHDLVSDPGPATLGNTSTRIE